MNSGFKYSIGCKLRNLSERLRVLLWLRIAQSDISSRTNNEETHVQTLQKEMAVWEEAFLGIDDLQGDYLLNLEKRVARLEAALEDGSGKGISAGQGKAGIAQGELPKLRTNSLD